MSLFISPCITVTLLPNLCEADIDRIRKKIQFNSLSVYLSTFDQALILKLRKRKLIIEYAKAETLVTHLMHFKYSKLPY